MNHFCLHCFGAECPALICKSVKTVNLGNLFWRDVMCAHGPPSCVRRKGGAGERREGRGAGPERSGGGRRQADRLAAGALNLTDGEG